MFESNMKFNMRHIIKNSNIVTNISSIWFVATHVMMVAVKSAGEGARQLELGGPEESVAKPPVCRARSLAVFFQTVQGGTGELSGELAVCVLVFCF